MTETTNRETIRLPLINKVLLASDHIGLQAIQYFRQTWIVFFLVPNTGEGVARVPDVTVLGLTIDARVFATWVLIFIGRLIDAFTDPLIGWWSDRTQSRWGRRIPFILFSTPFYALFAALVWFLPVEGASLWNALYFVIVLELFFSAATMSSGPLEALVPEVTKGPADRNNLVGLIFLLAVVGAAVGLPVGSALSDVLGFKTVGIILAVIGFVFRYISLASVWKHAPRHTPPAKVSFWGGLRGTLRNPQFIYYLPTFVMFTTGVGVLLGWVPFFAVGILNAEQEGSVVSLIQTVVIIGSVLSGIFFWVLLNGFNFSDLRRIPLFGRVLVGRLGIVVLLIPLFAVLMVGSALHRRFSFTKRSVYGGCLIASGVAFPLLALTGLMSADGLVTQGLVLAFIAGLPMSAVFMLPKGLTADIADYDALLTGERREAMFYATQNFFEKITYALPPGILALILLLGDTSEDSLGIRLAPVVAGVLAISGMALWHRYKLPDTISQETVSAAGLQTRVRPAPGAAD